MQFDLAYRAIAQPYRRKPLQFASASRTIPLPEAHAVADSMAHCNNNNVGDVPNDFKRHGLIQIYTISGGISFTLPEREESVSLVEYSLV
jgi:hypothetical protein